VNRTAHFWWYQREYVGRVVDGCHVPDELVVSFQKLLSPSFPRLLRRVALRCLALDEAKHRGLERPDSDELVARWRRARGLEADAAYRGWLRRHCLTEGELHAALGDLELEDRLLAVYRARYPEVRSAAALRRRTVRDVAVRMGLPVETLTELLLMRPGVPWSEPLIREMKRRGSFRRALRRAASMLRASARYFADDPTGGLSPCWFAPVNAFFARRWAIDERDLERAVAERGFAHYGLFFEAARHVYGSAVGGADPESLPSV
jgi:hypothetical protein